MRAAAKVLLPHPAEPPVVAAEVMAGGRDT